MTKIFLCLSSVTILSACSSLQDNSCNVQTPSAQTVQQAFMVGKSLEDALRNVDANVLIVARTGQDLSSYDITYSHAAFFVKERGKWQVYHLLNQCPSDVGNLYQEGLSNFVAPAMGRSTDFGVAIPPKAVQLQLAKILKDPAKTRLLFENNYNAIASPYTLENQNSNGWIIETYALAEAQSQGKKITNRTEAQTWLNDHAYAPTYLKVSGLKQAVAPMFVSNVSTKGHDRKDRSSSRLPMHSGDSLLQYVGGSMTTKTCNQLGHKGYVRDNYCEIKL